MNVYYNPEEFGLKLFGSLDEPNMGYSFNTLIVLEHLLTGRLFWAGDCGCSCPTPFEEFTFKYSKMKHNSPWVNTNLGEITPLTFDTFEKSVRDFPCDFQLQMDLLWKVKRKIKIA